MEVKKLIEELENRLKIGANLEIEKVLLELKHIDANIKDLEERRKAVKKIKDKQYEWLNTKDV